MSPAVITVPTSPPSIMSLSPTVSRKSLLLRLAPGLLLLSSGLRAADVYTWTTFSGIGSPGFVDSPAAFRLPSAAVLDSQGNLLVADTYNHTIRKITREGVATTLAGKAKVSGRSDGTGTSAFFNLPTGLTIDSSDNLYVADHDNNTIRKVTPDGIVTTIAGVAGLSGGNDTAAASGTNSSVQATFNGPSGIAIDSTGQLYVADQFNNTIRLVTTAGVVSTIAGSTRAKGFKDGTGTAALFNQPTSIARISDTVFCVADSQNNTIRKVTSAGVVTTLAGKAPLAGKLDGTGNTARFRIPTGVAVSGAATGNAAASASTKIFVTDQGNHTIRLVTPAGVVTTIGGVAGTKGAADGSFYYPRGLAVGTDGVLYVADRYNHRICKGKVVAGP